MAYSPYKMKGHTLPGIKQRASSPSKFNKGLKAASKAGKLDNNPKFKAAVDSAPTKMMYDAPMKMHESPAKGYKSAAQRKAVHASKKDGGKGAPTKMYGKESPAKNYKNPQDYKVFNMGNEPTPVKMYGKKDSPAKIIPGLGKTKYKDKLKAFGKAIVKGATASDQGINKAIRKYKSEKKKARDSYNA